MTASIDDPTGSQDDGAHESGAHEGGSHDDGSLLTGAFSDGRTARRHRVRLSVEGSGEGRKLHIAGDEASAVWPFRDIVLADLRRTGAAQLQRKGAMQRLSLAPEEADALRALAPDLLRKKISAGPIIGVASLVGVAFGVVAFALFGVPMLATPIARLTPVSVETRLGENSRAMIAIMTEPCRVPRMAQMEAERLAYMMGQTASARFRTRLEFVHADFANAFALPGGTIVVTDRLLAMLETSDQFAGVLAHETAHVARRHVMAAIVRQTGGAALIDLMLGGGSGAGQQMVALGAQLQSLRLGRKAEDEADALAIDYLVALGADPGGLAEFFDVIAEETGDDDLPFTALLQTHPTPSRRAEAARARVAALGKLPEPKLALSDKTWEALKSACAPEDDGEFGDGSEEDFDAYGDE